MGCGRKVPNTTLPTVLRRGKAQPWYPQAVRESQADGLRHRDSARERRTEPPIPFIFLLAVKLLSFQLRRR